MRSQIRTELNAHRKVLTAVIDTLLPEIEAACTVFTQTLQQGKKILLFGNGGSAADAQHLAAELTGHFRCERQGLPAIALSTDTSALTAIGNDYGYERIFSRQVEALAVSDDLLLGISTSGNSANVNEALRLGRSRGCATLGLTGNDGGAMPELCDVCLVVPENDTARIQEMHILIGHILCQISECSLFPHT